MYYNIVIITYYFLSDHNCIINNVIIPLSPCVCGPQENKLLEGIQQLIKLFKNYWIG